MGQLEDMNLLIRVVEAGGISRAADQLSLAKSAVSRRLVNLERRLGVSLINRTTRTSKLTETGRIYYKRALKVVEDVAELNAITMATNTSLKGTINFAAPLSFGLCHLSKAIDVFLELHPDLSINIDFSDRQVDLIEEGFDLAFRIADLKDSSLMARKISPINIILCASPGYLKKKGIPKNPGDLKKHRLLYYNLSTTPTWRLTDKKGNLHTIHVNANITANNGDFLKDMAIAGRGIVQSPTFITWQAIATGDLVPVLPHYSLAPTHAYAVYPHTRYLSQRTRILIDFLVQRFGENPYWDQNIKQGKKVIKKPIKNL